MTSHRKTRPGDKAIHKERPESAERLRTSPGDLLLRQSDFQIRLAKSPLARQKSTALVSRRYRWRGYKPAMPMSSLSTLDCLTVQACSGETVFGTLDICFGAEAKLPADTLYRTEIDAYRATGAVTCQVTRLAVDPEFGSKQVLGSLFHTVYVLAGPVRQASHLFIEVNPRHVAFYRRMLRFSQAGESKMCPRVQALAVLMHLAVAEAAEHIARHAGRAPGVTRSLYPYFCSDRESEQLARRLTALEALS